MQKRQELRLRRHRRVRKRVHGTPQRPRLAIYRSINHIYAQLIDDASGQTLAAASTLDQGLKSRLKSGGNLEAAREVGRLIGERAKAGGVERVVFDRGGFLYHGRIRALAEAAREAGLQF